MYQERSPSRLIVASELLPPSRGGTVSDVRLCVLKNMFLPTAAGLDIQGPELSASLLLYESIMLGFLH